MIFMIGIMRPDFEIKNRQDFVEYYLRIKLGSNKLVSGDKLVGGNHE